MGCICSDRNGNRTNTGYSTGTNNRLTSDGTFNYTYDAEGNRITRTRISGAQADDYLTEYTWDHHNRLTSVTFKNNQSTVTKSIQYEYDVFDRRVEATWDSDGSGPASAIVTRWVYDGTDLLLVFDGAGGLYHRYLHGPGVDQILADEQYLSGTPEQQPSSPGTVLWAIADNLGTIRDVVDSTGAVLNHLTFTAFGAIVSETNPNVEFAFGFTGRERGEATGQNFHRARYYDPAVGRWLSEDPIGFSAGDMNLARYVGNGPTNGTDPSGNIVIYVHGINEGQHSENAPYIADGLIDKWKRLSDWIAAARPNPYPWLGIPYKAPPTPPIYPPQAFIHFRHGPTTFWDAYWTDTALNRKVALELKALVYELQQFRAHIGSSEPIYIYAYSNGTTVTTYALEDGMCVDGVVFAGGALPWDHDMAKALKGTPWLVSFWSIDDGPTKIPGGIGSSGFSPTVLVDANGKIKEVYLSGVDHYGNPETKSAHERVDASHDWWEWAVYGPVFLGAEEVLRPEYRTEWDSYYMAYYYYAEYLLTKENLLSLSLDHLLRPTDKKMFYDYTDGDRILPYGDPPPPAAPLRVTAPPVEPYPPKLPQEPVPSSPNTVDLLPTPTAAPLPPPAFLPGPGP